ncbi:MAG: hypothetical protein HYV28_20385 [Ignavibacteriales bacterium]|nr:hypothetical protein [Ignavibacteriales bacterium]
MKLLTLILLLVAFTGTTTVFAHEWKDHKKHTMHHMEDTVLMVGKDTIAVNGKILSSSFVKQQPTAAKEPEFVLNPSDYMFTHLHNKLIHFPIALTLAAFLFTILHIRKKDYELVIRILLGASLLTSIAAYFTGNIQAAAFAGDPKEWLANTHRLAGILSIGLILIWFLLLFIARIKKHAWVMGILTIASIIITAFLGGILAH